MCPYIHIFSHDIPVYGLMMLLGMAAAFGVVAFQCGHFKYSRQEAFLTALIAVAGGMAGAILLKPIMKLPGVIINWDRYSQAPIGEFLSWFFGELVFYGGLIGGTLSVILYCRFFKMPVIDICDIFAPAVLVGQAFGRVGCLFAGCCYGIEVSPNNPLAIIYPPRTDSLTSLAAPTGVPVLALPLIEATGNIIIACIVMLLQRKSKTKGIGAAVYGILYSVFRFTLEFFRGDLVRGVYGGISTSQIISIIVLAVSVLWLVFISRKRRKMVQQ